MALLEQYSKEQLGDLYGRMLLIRRFEEAVWSAVKQKKFHGTTHLCIGQEATAVGACALLRQEDKIIGTHRGHGHVLAKGADPCKVMAEIYGKSTGLSKGKGGSMHLADPTLGILGTNAVVGGGIPIAVGSALRSQMLDAGDVTVCFFGDGAVNEGSFHEAVNMAAIWKLPIIFFCENNKYGMSSPAEKMMVERIAKRAGSYGIEAVTIDGNNLEAVLSTMKDALAAARVGDGPFLIEAETYRFYGHSKSDKQLYRSQTEVDAWREKDPIIRLEQCMYEEQVFDESELGRMRAFVMQIVEDAIEYAETSAAPALDELYTNVYAAKEG